jgi:hypothetical protein
MEPTHIIGRMTWMRTYEQVKGRASGKGSAAPRYTTMSSGEGSHPSWESVPAGAIQAAVAAITSVGDAITFATTRDGGALTFMILHDGDRIPKYGHSPDEMAEHLAHVTEAAAAFLRETQAGK